MTLLLRMLLPMLILTQTLLRDTWIIRSLLPTTKLVKVIWPTKHFAFACMKLEMILFCCWQIKHWNKGKTNSQHWVQSYCWWWQLIVWPKYDNKYATHCRHTVKIYDLAIFITTRSECCWTQPCPSQQHQTVGYSNSLQPFSQKSSDSH